MVYIGDREYVPREDADAEFLEKVREKMLAMKRDQAAREGWPDPATSSRPEPQRLIKEQIKAAGPYGLDPTLAAIEDCKRLKPPRSAQLCREEEAQTTREGRPASSEPAKLRKVRELSPGSRELTMNSKVGFHRGDAITSWKWCRKAPCLHEFDPDDERLVDCEQKDLAPVAEAPISHKRRSRTRRSSSLVHGFRYRMSLRSLTR